MSLGCRAGEQTEKASKKLDEQFRAFVITRQSKTIREHPADEELSQLYTALLRGRDGGK